MRAVKTEVDYLIFDSYFQNLHSAIFFAAKLCYIILHLFFETQSGKNSGRLFLVGFFCVPILGTTVFEASFRHSETFFPNFFKSPKGPIFGSLIFCTQQDVKTFHKVPSFPFFGTVRIFDFFYSLQLMSFLNDCGKDLRFFRHRATFFQYNFHLVKGYPFTLKNVFGLKKKRLASGTFLSRDYETFARRKKNFGENIFLFQKIISFLMLEKSSVRVLCVSFLVFLSL